MKNQNYHRYESYNQRRFKEEDRQNSTAGYLIGALLLGIGITISSCNHIHAYTNTNTNNQTNSISHGSFSNRLERLLR